YRVVRATGAALAASVAYTAGAVCGAPDCSPPAVGSEPAGGRRSPAAAGARSGGSQSTNVTAPRGEASSVTASTGRPVNRDAAAAGSPAVAEASTNTGRSGSGGGAGAGRRVAPVPAIAVRRRRRRSTCATWEPNTPR